MLNDLRHYDLIHGIKRDGCVPVSKQRSLGELFLIAAIIVGVIDWLAKVYG